MKERKVKKAFLAIRSWSSDCGDGYQIVSDAVPTRGEAVEAVIEDMKKCEDLQNLFETEDGDFDQAEFAKFYDDHIVRNNSVAWEWEYDDGIDMIRYTIEEIEVLL